jgi:hypothetical protein
MIDEINKNIDIDKFKNNPKEDSLKYKSIRELHLYFSKKEGYVEIENENNKKHIIEPKQKHKEFSKIIAQPDSHEFIL